MNLRAIPAIIDAASVLATIVGLLVMVRGMIHSKEYYERMEKMERAWIERVCIGGPME